MDRVGSALVDRPGQEQAVVPPSRADRARSAASRWTRGPRGLAALLVLVLVAGLVVLALTRGPATPPLTGADVDKAVQAGIADAQRKARQAPPDAATAYQAALPSLVTIVADARSGPQRTGAGVVANDQGAVLTALHVVDGSSRIRVTFSDGSVATATVDQRRPAQDIAVLKPAQLPGTVVPAVLGGGVQVGDAVFALGHPLGLSHSLSGGLVSALDRTVRVDANRTLTGLIQFDAAVNPGNSGGPLLDRDGQVVGIVTGLANPSREGFFVGIGFAVPIAIAGGAAGAPAQ